MVWNGFKSMRQARLMRRLSQHHNKEKGFGAMDILHVASALDMGCDTLLSFDGSQRAPAKAEGLKVLPV
jgi:hypothetical protein